MENTPKGAFCLSFDTELAWGVFDYPDFTRYRKRLVNARSCIDRLCRLLDTYRIPATWAIVGRLMRPAAEARTGAWSPEITAMIASCADNELSAPDIVERIRSCSTPQEVASHSFSHIPYDERRESLSRIDEDLRRAREAAEALGLTPRSFVFPFNIEGFHARLRDAGFTGFRGDLAPWFGRWPRGAARLGRLIDQTLGVTPPVSPPIRHPSGLWNIPASMFLMSYVGLRGLGGARARFRKARRGIRRAVAHRSVFHLWTHPHNFFEDTPRMLATLERILALVRSEVDRGRLEALSMGEIARRAASSHNANEVEAAGYRGIENA